MTDMQNLKSKKETVVDYWNARPCNIRHSNASVGSKEYFDSVEERKYFVEPHIPKFADFASWKAKKVLEIGCGIGTDTINFARAGARVTAVDISYESLKIARQRAKVFDLEGRICFHEADAEHLSRILDVQSYDLIYSFGVIHHTPQPDLAISELVKFCGPESELRLMLYAKNSWKDIMIEAGLDQPEAQSGCPVAYTYSKSEVVELLSPFKDISIEQDHIFPYQIEPYKQYLYELCPWFEKMPAEMFQALQKNLGWHLLIKAKF